MHSSGLSHVDQLSRSSQQEEPFLFLKKDTITRIRDRVTQNGAVTSLLPTLGWLGAPSAGVTQSATGTRVLRDQGSKHRTNIQETLSIRHTKGEGNALLHQVQPEPQRSLCSCQQARLVQCSPSGAGSAQALRSPSCGTGEVRSFLGRQCCCYFASAHLPEYLQWEPAQPSSHYARKDNLGLASSRQGRF